MKVWRITSSHAGGWQNAAGSMSHTISHPRAYHTNPTCLYLHRVDPDRIVETTREQAEQMGLDECKVCAGKRSKLNTLKSCPLCGEKIHHLGKHLPKCPER